MEKNRIENSLIIGRDTKYKVDFTIDILNKYIKTKKQIIIYNKHKNFKDEIEKNFKDKNIENLEYIDDLEALHFYLTYLEDENEEAIVYLYDFEEDMIKKENEELRNTIINIIKNQDNTNIKFIISVSLIGYDYITYATKDYIVNRIVFMVSKKISNDLRLYNTDIETFEKIMNIKDNEFLTYRINKRG
jgi:hypothetical protein